MSQILDGEAQVVVDHLSQLPVGQTYEYLKHTRDSILYGVARALDVPWSIERVPTAYGVTAVIYGADAADKVVNGNGDFYKYWTIPPEKENKMQTVETLVNLLRSHHDKTLHDRLLRELGDDIVKAIGSHIGLEYDDFVQSCKDTGVEEYVQVEYIVSYISEIVNRLEKHRAEVHYIFDCKVIVQNICENDSMSIRSRGDEGQYTFGVILNTTLPLKGCETNSTIHPTVGITYTHDSEFAYSTYEAALKAAEGVVTLWGIDELVHKLPHMEIDTTNDIKEKLSQCQ